jgi:hypothetical protein
MIPGRPNQMCAFDSRLRGEVGSHRRCDPGEGDSPRVGLLIEPLTPLSEASLWPLPVKNGGEGAELRKVMQLVQPLREIDPDQYKSPRRLPNAEKQTGGSADDIRLRQD